MANPTDPDPERFRADLDDGGVLATDGSTLPDRLSGAQVPALLLRMTPARAHVLAHVLDSWTRTAALFTIPGPAEAAGRALAWTLEAGAAALGDPAATLCLRNRPAAPTAAQRLAALEILRDRAPSLTPVQAVAVIDAAARWLAEDAGAELAQALLQAASADDVAASFAYLALVESPRVAQ